MSKSKKRARLRVNSNIPTALLILLEIFAIVIGVMLGFAVNEWRENRNNMKIVENAMESVASEFNYNHNRMVESFEYYSFIVNQIDSLNRAGEPVRDMYGWQLDGWRGAMPPMLRSSTYQMILTTGIFKDIPFETANALAFVYNLQSLLERLDDSAVQSFSVDSGFTALQNIRHLFNLYVEIIPSVIGSYQKIGLTILSEYGYDLELPEGPLKEISDNQTQGMTLTSY